MPNVRFNKLANTRGADRKADQPGGGKSAAASMPMKTANWPGLPGKAQPRDRSNGVPKLANARVKSEGL